ncbi:NAD(P)H-hydrate dehydratase [Gemmatimonas sp.]|uniref:NAD(P)H-hydrate dehydratase n=1 Tax=Gemmatimonas sp. TaxID=1962908 RepID=UPI00398349CC
MSAWRVTSAAEAAARDHAAITAGVASFDLMLQAGTTAAALILRDYAAQLSHGVALFAGSGNNGGDAYVVAAQLARVGVSVRLHAAAPPRTADAVRAMRLAAPALVFGPPGGHERVVVDGLLGTGHRGALREPVLAACRRVSLARDGGSTIVALDVPSGLDATTGEIADGSTAAHATLCFGTVKRGLLLARGHAGRIVLLDIGLAGAVDREDGAWHLANAADFARWLPPMAWNAHKGRRGRVAIVGGHEGMAGAVILATRAALAAGAGLAHAIVDAPSVMAVQLTVPQALAERWPEQAAELAEPGAEVGAEPGTLDRCDALAIGPGLGRSARSSQLLERMVNELRDRPLVLDADALWLVAEVANTLGTDAAAHLRHWTRHSRAVVCTPHEGEFARLLGAAVPPEWDKRADALRQFAVRSGVTMLLKGTPTLVATPDGGPITVVPHGTPLLATGGSGDMLSGVIVALLGQGLAPKEAAVCAATVHGRAAELATARQGGPRGGTLETVFESLPSAWRLLEDPVTFPPGVLVELPSPA